MLHREKSFEFSMDNESWVQPATFHRHCPVQFGWQDGMRSQHVQLFDAFCTILPRHERALCIGGLSRCFVLSLYMCLPHFATIVADFLIPQKVVHAAIKTTNIWHDVTQSHWETMPGTVTFALHHIEKDLQTRSYVVSSTSNMTGWEVPFCWAFRWGNHWAEGCLQQTMRAIITWSWTDVSLFWGNTMEHCWHEKTLNTCEKP